MYILNVASFVVHLWETQNKKTNPSHLTPTQHCFSLQHSEEQTVYSLVCCVGVPFFHWRKEKRSNWMWRLVNVNSYKQWQRVSANKSTTVPVGRTIYLFIHSIYILNLFLHWGESLLYSSSALTIFLYHVKHTWYNKPSDHYWIVLWLYVYYIFSSSL